MFRMPVLTLVFAVSVVPLVACDAQVDSSHQGNPLATLSGSLTTTSATPSADAEVSVVWGVQSGGLSLVGADSVEVEGSFPAAFELSIFEPPTEEMLGELDGTRFGLAYIVAGWDGGAGLEDPWLGAELAHVLVYLVDSPAADSELALLLRGSPTPGYHLYDAHQLTEEETEARNQCVSDLFNADNSHMPTTQEMFAACGGARAVDLFPAENDLETPLSVELLDGVDINDLPHSW